MDGKMKIGEKVEEVNYKTVGERKEKEEGSGWKDWRKGKGNN